jgi:hypothetical protein
LRVVGNKREFRFELFWIKHPDFLKKVSEIWNAPTRDVNNLDKVLFKLKKVKKSLKGWGYNLSESRKKRKKEIQDSLAVLEELEERGPLSPTQCENKIRWKAELLQILEDEELYWFKRSHETWLLRRDNNTEYFHRIANGRKRNQTIFSLKNGASTVRGTNDLLAHAIDFYRNLFSPWERGAFEFDTDLWQDQEKVFDLENEELINPFTEEEIKSALFSMEKNKAAGPDGLSIEFYQHCWEIIKADMVLLF